MRLSTGIVIAVCLSFAVPLTHARKLTVTNPNDSGPGSLRQAILDAAPGDEIRFDRDVDGQPIVLTGGQLRIDKDLAITGNGAEDTVLDGNFADRVFLVDQGTVTITGVTVQNGLQATIPGGGGVFNAAATLTVQDCTFAGNSGDWCGGAIRNEGTLVVILSTFTGNSTGKWGAGIFNDEDGQVTILNSTFIGNNSDYSGGGLYNWGTAVIRNSTFSRNSGWGCGGGIFSGRGATLAMHSVTVTENWSYLCAAGVYASTSESVTMENCIVASQLRGRDCAHHPTSLGHNLDSDGTCNLNKPTDLPSTTDPMLGPCACNGGSTWTHALLPGSPAIDAGSASCDARDQRGTRRFLDGDDDGVQECDIGSFEWDFRSCTATPALLDVILDLTGADHDLVAPLQETVQILEDGDPSNDGLAVEFLLAFIAEVEDQRGLALSDAEATELIAEAQRIIALVNPGGSLIGSS